MTANPAIDSNQLSKKSVEELKQEILELTRDRDRDPLNQKVKFYQNKLAPIFEELSRRNPHPNPEEQVSLVLGVWSPVWSTIPFQDIIPGRMQEESYQIFHDDGYYANIARYAPGHRLPFLSKLSSILFAYDLMLLQKYEIRDGDWYIQNIGIKQGLRIGAAPLTIDKAEDWFTRIVQSKSKLSSETKDAPQIPLLKSLNRKIAKQTKGAFKATPQFEHLYIDPNFRLVKTRREAKQRPSYTIAVRKD
ncbi:hypothetical protein IQ238_03135 [Pleurocapsales cyanobacterium LEGE 06147]|nr:hypothetical protein [Pleurocapsales cyanobacterium LEGE 06147]